MTNQLNTNREHRHPRPMRTPIVGLAVAVLIFAATVTALADFPKPSPYPVTWELEFDADPPRRLVMTVPGSSTPKVFWYMTYTVTNKSNQEQTFLPFFEMLSSEGHVMRSDRNIPPVVFDRIKRVTARRFLEPWTAIGGEIRIGEDEARDGVAIWEEPAVRMGAFSVFVGGLSGETAIAKDARGAELKDADGNPVILRKTLRLNFEVPGDERFASDAEIKEVGREWIMR